MEIIISCICIIISLISLIMIIYVSNKNSYQILLVRINEALKNIEYFLDKKEENLKKAITTIKETNKRKYSKKEILPNLIKNKNIKQNIFDKDNNLRENLNEFIKILENDEKLTDNKKINKIYFDSIEIDNDLMASKKYYNKIANQIDESFKKFPKNILKGILKYKQLERFNTKKEIRLEILKEEEEKSPKKA